MLTTVAKKNVFAALFTILRVWLGFKWIEAGFHKIHDGFDASGFLQGAIANPVLDKATNEPLYAWYISFLKSFALPNVELFNILIPWGEVLVGLGLIVGLLTIPALIAGGFMNFNFLLAGTVSSNPLLLVAAVILLFAHKHSRKFGLDRFVKYTRVKEETVINNK